MYLYIESFMGSSLFRSGLRTLPLPAWNTATIFNLLLRLIVVSHFWGSNVRAGARGNRIILELLTSA